MKKFLQYLTIGLFLLSFNKSFAQYVVDFEDASKGSYASGTVTLNGIDWNMTEALIGTSLTDYYIGAKSARLRGYGTSEFTMLADKTNGIGNVSFTYRRYGSDAQLDWKVESSIDAGATWQSVGTPFTAPATGDTMSYLAAVNISVDARIRIVRATADANASNKRINIDNMLLTDFGSGGTIDTTVTITTADASVLENVGTVTVTIALNQAPVLDKTVELILNSGNAAIVNGYTPQTVTFTGGSTSETVTLTIVPGQLVSASETLEFGLNNVGTGLMYGADTLFNLTVNEMPPAITPCSQLYFSEYIKGSSQNKALEIYNPTTAIIDLSNYEIRKYTNGSATSSSVSLSGMLIPGDVYVVSHSSADAAILLEADMTTGFFDFNGDDAIELYDTTNMVSVDVIGEIGVDPGASWPVGTGSTSGFTLTRMASIDAGTTTWSGVGDQQWDVNPNNDFSFIGSHTNTSCTAAIPLTAYPLASSMEVCLGDTILFTHNSFGGTAPYTAGWEINSVQTLGDNLEYIATTAGVISVTFAVVDALVATDDSVFTIKVNAAPTNGLTFDNSTVCAMDTAMFTSSATGVSVNLTYAYALSPSGVLMDSANGSGNGYIVPDTDGTFTLSQMVTDSLGCAASQDYTVTSNMLDDATFGVLTNFCEGDTLTLIHSNTGGIWSGTIVTDQTGGNGFAQGAAGVHDVTYTTTGTCPDAHTESVETYATPTAAYTFSGNITVGFTNTSTGSATCEWTFGDGNTSTLCSPSHTYATDGSYTVCLTVTSADGCVDSICQSVTIQGVGVEEINANLFSMYPNPTNGKVTINTATNSAVQLINIVGEIVWSSNVQKTAELDFTYLSKGSYFVKVNSNGKIETKKLIIQ